MCFETYECEKWKMKRDRATEVNVIIATYFGMYKRNRNDENMWHYMIQENLRENLISRKYNKYRFE